MRGDQSSRPLEGRRLAKLPPRDRLLLLLKRRGPSRAADLARALAITGEAVRQQLLGLQTQGWVRAAPARRGVGRPAWLWRLSPAANHRFPDAHADVIAQLTRAVRRALGARALERVVAAREREVRQRYASALRAAATLRERVRRLAGLRSAEGYMAEWETAGRGFRLIENHCPISGPTAVCLRLCQGELRLFRHMVGSGATVSREEHILSGDRRCLYRIEPKTRRRSRAPSPGRSADGS